VNLHFCGLVGVLRRRRYASHGDDEPASGHHGSAPTDAISREASRRSAEAMRRMFPKLSSWQSEDAFLDRIGEADRYLAQATDPIDLERRIGDIERRAIFARGSP